MKFTSARRHDSINFLYAIDEFGRHGMGLTPTNMCLDSAHDNLPTKEPCMELTYPNPATTSFPALCYRIQKNIISGNMASCTVPA